MLGTGRLERAGWTPGRAGVDGQGRTVRMSQDAGRHSALVCDLQPVQLHVADGDLTVPRN